MKKLIMLMLLPSLLLSAHILAASERSLPPQPRPPMLSPQDELKQIELPTGYRMELVLSEPTIEEPVITVFDGNGRMFVAEMRSYMQDIDGKNELTPVSRVSMHVDTNGDGKYDRHTVFIDHLVLPRMLLPLDDSLLVMETDSGDIYRYWDTNGDGVADKKELFYHGEARRANLEHQPSGLIWSLDNWIYTTVNAWRIRWTPQGIIREPTAPNGGQWGLAQDNYGKPWIVNAGGERGPLNFQEPIVYGAFNVPDEVPPDYREVYPLVAIPDVQGGTARFRPREKTLNHFTATCGAEIVRGDQLPDDIQGDLLFAEPVGRLIRRSKIEVRDGLTYLHNVYPGSEFIRSHDPNFRPVNIANAPDGTVYITDMYRGIIQEGNWVRPGSYLRTIVQQYQFDKNTDHGRIWRLAHVDTRKVKPPHMLDESSARLVQHLESKNGWTRDTAQKLLVLRQDKTVVPALKQMAAHDRRELARIHAIWTLEGLGALNPDFIRHRLADPDTQVRVAAIRASESLFRAGNDDLRFDLKLAALDGDPDVAIQAMLTMDHLKLERARDLIANLITDSSSRGVREIGRQLLTGPQDAPESVQLSAAERQQLTKGSAIYTELCFACHGNNGQGAPIDGAKGTMAPPLAGSKTVNGTPAGIVNVILHGLNGPVQGRAYTALMVPMGANDDTWVAAIASFVRNSFGNEASFVTPAEVAQIRRESAARTTPWTLDELHAVLPQPIENRQAWKLTASHNQSRVRNAIDGNMGTRFDTGTPQVPGMWFQIELPQPTTVSEINLNTRGSNGDYPRGYEVRVSDDGTKWSDPIARGKGNGPVTDITFDPVKTRFIRITDTGRVNGLFWSIHELNLFRPGKKIDFAGKSGGPPAQSFE